MKYYTLIIIGFILIQSLIQSKKTGNKKNSHKHHTHSHSHSKSNEICAIEAKNYVNGHVLHIVMEMFVQNLSCSFCDTFSDDGYKTYYTYSPPCEHNRHYQFVVVYSDFKKEVIISFSGPTTEHLKYFSSIYESGFVQIPELDGIQIEREYWTVYSEYFRELLAEILEKFKESGRSHYRFIFVGHSVGGSLSTLAAYDMVFSNILLKTAHSPIAYVYGPLRIGDDSFERKINALKLKIIKIIRKDDYVTVMPRCIWKNGSFTCYDNRRILKNVPELRTYFKRYLTPSVVGIRRRNPFRLPFRFKETSSKVHSSRNPIQANHSWVNGNLVLDNRKVLENVLRQPFIQSIGKTYLYNGPSFGDYNVCRNCGTQFEIPLNVDPSVHANYYGTYMETCDR